MRAEQFQRAKEILAGALEHPPESRDAYLRDTCGDDADLRAEVESLLRHHTTKALIETLGASPDEIVREDYVAFSETKTC